VPSLGEKMKEIYIKFWRVMRLVKRDRINKILIQDLFEKYQTIIPHKAFESFVNTLIEINRLEGKV
jgi:hypothetical protein